MKNLYFAIFAITFGALLFASCTDKGPVKPSGPVLELLQADTLVNGSTLEEIIYCFASFQNISDKPVKVLAKTEVISLTEGHEYSICLGWCFPNQTTNTITGDPYLLEPGELMPYKAFSIDYYSYGSQGSGEFKVTIFPEDDPENSISYNLKVNVAF